MILFSAGMCRAEIENVSQVVAARISSAPVLDGKMGDPAWAKATEVGGFTVLGTRDKSPVAPTYIKVLTDGKSLFIGFRCVEPNLAEIKTPIVPRDGEVWAQECVEVVIDSVGDRKNCYHLIGGLSGVEFDSKLSILPTGAIDDDSSWNGDWDLKSWRGENEWRCEMRVPFSTIGADPAKNPILGINFNRARWVGNGELSNWSPNSLKFSEPENLGELILPDADGSYCRVYFPRLRSVVAGRQDVPMMILNYSNSKILPGIDFKIDGPKPQSGRVQLDAIEAGYEPTAAMSLDIDRPGNYTLLMNLTDSITGKPIYKISRDIEVTQAFVFDEKLYALYQKRVDATLELRVPAENSVVRVSLMKDGVDAPIASRTIESGLSSPMKVSFPLAKQQEGVYRLKAEMLKDGKVTASAVSRNYPYKPNPKIALDKDGYIVADGKPFFPIGIYSVENQDGSASVKIAKEIKDAGFNCTVLYHEKPSQLLPVLDACQEAGLKAFVYPTLPFVNWKNGLTSEIVHKDIDARRNHPAILGWYVVDEPEGIGKAPVQPVRDMYQMIKEYDQDHPCTAVIMSPRAAKDYHSCCDIMWTDPYPVPRQPVTYVSEYVSGAVKNIESDKPLWCIPQAFDWSVWNHGKVDNIHRPTDDEERCMTYLALVNGAKGIIYWAYTSSKYHITDYPEHWAYMKKLAGEISSISPVLVTPTVNGKLTSSDKNSVLQTMVKKSNGDWYVFAVNSSTSPCTGSFKLSGAKRAQLDVMFEHRSVSVKNGNWTDEFKPLEVHVYKLPAR
jgi:hypothetical protein